jgi:hypothetical protein
VDKMIVDLALEHISESPDMVVDVPITGDAAFPYPSSTAFFDLRIRCHPEDASRIEVLLDKPVKQAKYMPPMYVLQHIVQTCFEEVTRASCPDGIVVSCFTELQLSESLVRSNHGFDDASESLFRQNRIPQVGISNKLCGLLTKLCRNSTFHGLHPV